MGKAITQDELLEILQWHGTDTALAAQLIVDKIAALDPCYGKAMKDGSPIFTLKSTTVRARIIGARFCEFAERIVLLKLKLDTEVAPGITFQPTFEYPIALDAADHWRMGETVTLTMAHS